MTTLCARAITATFATLISVLPMPALTITDFRKLSKTEQAIYVEGAISMTAYTYASNGDTRKARCIKDWYFGKAGQETPGPRQLAIEIGVAEQSDPDKFHVEGVILGLTDKVCPAERAPAR